MKTPQTLPMMALGTVHAQFVRCNRLGCRCAAGQLHGPYFFRFWREAGRLRKEYVPRERVEEVRAQCEARRAFVLTLRADRQVAAALLETLSSGDAP